MTIETVRVDLDARSYDVRIGQGLLDRAGEEIRALAGPRRVAILTDETVAGLHLPRLQQSLAQAGLAASSLALPAGEATKSWAELGRAVEWLLSCRIERKDLVIALGGGVIGDLAGFAAAILRRGCRWSHGSAAASRRPPRSRRCRCPIAAPARVFRIRVRGRILRHRGRISREWSSRRHARSRHRCR